MLLWTHIAWVSIVADIAPYNVDNICPQGPCLFFDLLYGSLVMLAHIWFIWLSYFNLSEFSPFFFLSYKVSYKSLFAGVGLRDGLREGL